MATVPFCNLNDAFPDWTNKNTNKNLKRTIDSDTFNEKVDELHSINNSFSRTETPRFPLDLLGNP